MNLEQVYRVFPDRWACLKYLEALRWGRMPRCAHCNSERVGRINMTQSGQPRKNRREGRFNCYDCKSTFSVISGTMFHKTKLSLTKWFAAIHYVLKSRKGVSSYQLARYLGISDSSAWYLLTRIRREMKAQNENTSLLKGIVEADEAWVGGKPKGKRPEGASKRPTRKMTYLGAIEREGRVHVELADEDYQPRSNAMIPQVEDFVRRNVDSKTTIITDGFSGYSQLNRFFTAHHVFEKEKTIEVDDPDNPGEIMKIQVSQIKKEREIAKDGVKICTNQIEGFWFIIKQAWYSTHQHYSRKYAPLYIAEAVFRYNSRNNTHATETFLSGGFPARI